MFRKMAKTLKSLDSFPKVLEEYQHRSQLGGFVSFIVYLLMGYLALSELSNYLTLKQTYEFLVEPKSGNNEMQINLDMTIAMACNFVNIDVKDASGNSIHMNNQIKTYPAKFEIKSAHLLGSHVTSQDSIGKLVEMANKKEDFNPSLSTDSTSKSACRIRGSFQVKKVAGNFHVTAQGHGHGGEHVPHTAFNFTHRIDQFSFGQNYPKLINPLDNSMAISNSAFDMFQYFLSVVPTIYIDNYEQTIITNQYSVTNHKAELGQMTSISPGIFFQYSIEPLLVRVTEKRPPLTKFLVRLCGIIGGIFVSAGFVHRGLAFLLEKVRAQKKSSPRFSKNSF